MKIFYTLYIEALMKFTVLILIKLLIKIYIIFLFCLLGVNIIPGKFQEFLLISIIIIYIKG